MVVQHNMQAMNANRMLSITSDLQAKTTEKLSSGYKINRAADDAAGLSISEKMRKQIRGLDQASTNAQDGISAVQTAEGALTEVHSMLQRMNELAVQAANGTNSVSDRQSIQDEIEQLTTEIDRVAETTKFNETYLLKGNGKTATFSIAAKDAGITGSLIGAGTGTAKFIMAELKAGDTINIGSKGYTIGTSVGTIRNLVPSAAGTTITINGTTYEVKDKATTEDNVDNKYSQDQLKGMIKDGDTVIIGTNKYIAMTDKVGNGNSPDGVSDSDASVITTAQAYKLIAKEILSASSMGVDPGQEAKTAAGSGTNVGGGFVKNNDTKNMELQIKEGKVKTQQCLQVGLHVGADADETNKITFNIDKMDAAGLGIKGLNIVDTSGAKATYAIDSISDALAKVSAQRSTLGAVQNRLEHTIANLDNVVENTTAAESEIRDTDMAAEMVDYTKNNILAQAGQAMLAQANQSTQGVLSLLG